MREQEYKPCEYCKEPTEKFYCQNGYVTSTERRFCSCSCSNRSRAIEKTCPTKECEGCKKEIDKYQHIIKNGKKYFKKDERKYCSLKCVAQAKRRTDKRTCNVCNQNFTCLISSKKKYCSKSCFYNRKANKKENYCKNCNREILDNKRSIFCSKECYNEDKQKIIEERNTIKECPVCKAFLCGPQKIFCSEKCKNSAKSEKRRNDAQRIKLDLVMKSDNKCSLCNKSYRLSSYCFHHRGDKNFTLDVSNLLKKEHSEILLEFDKCDLLCHNCHAVLHEKERRIESLNKMLSGLISRNNYLIKRKDTATKKLMIKEKGGSCEECGFSSKYTQCMSFDHKDPGIKSFELNVCNIGRYSKNKVKNELDKCRLLCMNCHIGKNPDR